MSRHSHRFFRCSLALLLLFSGHGQSLSQQSPSTLATALSDGMAALLQVDNWPCLYTGKFEQRRLLQSSGISIKSSGQFLFDCQYGLLWETTNPVASTQVYRHAGERYAVDSTGRAKVLSGRVQARIASLLLALMGGDASSLEEDFTHTGNAAESAAEGTVVLLPRRAALAQRIQQIAIAHRADAIDISILSPDGGGNEIQLSKLQTQQLPAVTVCATQSPQAAVTCPLLFDAVNGNR